MFYSVPHKGSVLADVTLPLLRRSVELIEIQRSNLKLNGIFLFNFLIVDCEFVLDMHRRFVEICEQGHLGAEIFSFIETSFTLMSFIYLKIVAYDSAGRWLKLLFVRRWLLFNYTRYFVNNKRVNL